MRQLSYRLLFLFAALGTAGASFAERPGGQRYVVTLTAAAAVDGAPAVARDLVDAHGGSVGAVSGDTFTIDVTAARARLLARDPRVQSVAPAAVTAASTPPPAEKVNWASGVSYAYDSVGNVRQMGGDAFAYDHVSRLVKAEINDVVREYAYDAYGNRRSCVQNPNTAVAADCQGGLTIRSSNNRIAEATYDPSGRGNVVALQGRGYSYDAVDMITRATGYDGTREFIYTASDDRLATYRVDGGSWHWTLRDVSGKVLREFSSRDGAEKGAASFAWTKDYVWRKDGLLASVHPAGNATVTYHYHLDHLGTPRRITDDNEAIVGFHDYHAFGPEVSGGLQEPSPTPLKYTGHERDTVTDPNATLDYMRARYYHPMLGRFMSVDRVLGKRTRPQSWNRYAYAHNNPLTNVDPDGNVVIVAKEWRNDVAHAYANSPTFRAEYDAAHQNPAVVSRLNLTFPMKNNTRASTVPLTTAPMRVPNGSAVLRDAKGNLIVKGVAFSTSIPVGSTAAVIGHELKHVNEGATFGYTHTPKMLIPLAPTIYQNTTATGGGQHYESTDALSTEAQIQKELDAGGKRTLSPAERTNIFGPSEQFDTWSRRDQQRCSTDPTCFSTNPPTANPRS